MHPDEQFSMAAAVAAREMLDRSNNKIAERQRRLDLLASAAHNVRLLGLDVEVIVTEKKVTHL